MSRVIVVGSINMDLVAYAERMPVAGESLRATDFGMFPGGKGANQALAARKAGAESVFIGCVGKDVFGPIVNEFFSSQGVNMSQVLTVDGTTGIGIVLIDASGENRILVMPGANMAVDVPDIFVTDTDIVLCQLEIPIATTISTLEQAKACGATTILSLAPALPFERTDLADYLLLNEVEAEMMGLTRPEPGQTIIKTLGEKGARAEGNVTAMIQGIHVGVVDTTGAGDCFAGSFAGRLAAGDSAETALQYANAAAALSVTRKGAGTSLPERLEVEGLLERERGALSS